MQLEESGPGDERAFGAWLVGAGCRPSGLAAARASGLRGGDGCRVLCPLFHKPDSEVACQLEGAFFESVESGNGGRRLRREQALEDSVGVFLPLLTKGVAIREYGHGNLEGQEPRIEVSYGPRGGAAADMHPVFPEGFVKQWIPGNR